MGIIERDLTLEERDPDTLTLEEARTLIRQQNERFNNMGTVKKEKRNHTNFKQDDGHDDSGVEVTGEESVHKRRKGTAASDVEVVDLSGD